MVTLDEIKSKEQNTSGVFEDGRIKQASSFRFEMGRIKSVAPCEPELS